MVSVTARKIREQGVDRAGAPARIYTGYLISYPYVGRGMVIFRDPHGHRMITTPVRRVLGEPGGKKIYVETENSVYRLEIHGEPMFPMRLVGDLAPGADPLPDGPRRASAMATDLGRGAPRQDTPG
jgi:hypothetical protein